MEYILEIKNLVKEYNKFRLNNISFDLPKGYIMGLIGPNGAGKTTIIKLIMNLIKKNSGQINIFGKDNMQNEAEIKSRIGFVYDSHPYYEDVSLKDIAAAIAPCYSTWDNKVFSSLISKFDINPKMKFGKLSRGMKMKFSLALAFSHHADFIIMDEPTSGLDPAFRRELLEILSEIIQDEKKSVLFSTHITSDLEKIADYITYIRNGEIVFSSTKDEILENWAVVKGGEELLSDNFKQSLLTISRNEYGITALTNNRNKIDAIKSSDLVIEKASLEDIIYYMEK